MATNTLEHPPTKSPPDERPLPREFRSGRDSDDIDLLFDAVAAEDARRALAARQLAVIHRAARLTADIELVRDEVLTAAEGELRTWTANLASTLDATAERVADLVAEMQPAGFEPRVAGRLADGDSVARHLLARVSGSTTD